MSKSYNGLDLSYCQPSTTNFADLKKAGYEFCILRAAYGNCFKYPSQKDTNFETFYRNAKAAGLMVGAYLYSYARDRAEAIEEAKGLIEIIKGKQFEYPIYIDIEETSSLNSGKVDEIAEGFCSTLENAGYFAGVYCSTWFTNNKFKPETVKRFSWWVADWTGVKPELAAPYGVWQTGKTKINGAYYDTDMAYEDFKAIMQKNGLNGYLREVEKPSAQTADIIKLKQAYAALKASVDELGREVEKL